ncbi:MAG TPA: VWA domain-containing protein [Acidobacteriaceae bacterium]|jgi:VWFA-related protein|nr:VWA domain-containing protein [Acidobacteriaceae bacterium]
MLTPVWAAQEQASGTAPSGAAAQQSGAAAGQSAPVPVFRTNANLVLVDVVVRNKQQPVLGLTQSDFQIKEDGKQQAITIFEEHRATDAPEVAKTPQLPPHMFSNAPQYAVTSAANVLLLDGLNTPLSDQVYVRRRMLKYLATIPPGTRIAVFTLGSKLHIITGFTTNAGEIAKAMETGRGQAERSPVLDADFDNAMNLQNNLGQALGLSGVAVAGIAQFLSDTQNFEVGLREEMTIDALDQIARYLSTIPGRKNLVWFSASFPLRYLQGGASPNADPMADYSGMVKKAAELLALSRVAVYPIDSRGLLNTPSSDASTVAGIANAMQAAPNGASGQGSVGTGGGGNTGMGSFSMDQVASSGASVNVQPGVGGEVGQGDTTFMNDTTWDHFNMDQIAKETGGVAYYNRNHLGQAVDEAIANGSSYYTIGYTPADRNYNGALRNIDVQVEGGNYALEYRHAYFADDPAQEVKWTPGRQNPLVDAMQHGTPGLSQVMFQVRVLPAGDPALQNEKVTPGPAGGMAGSLKNPQRYVVDYWIDPRLLDHKTMADGKQETQVELTEVAYDDEGIRVNFADQGLDLMQTPEQVALALKGGLGVHEQIDLPPGRIYLKVGVHDILSGSLGTLEIPIVAGGGRQETAKNQ